MIHIFSLYMARRHMSRVQMIHIFGLCLFAWAENKRLKVLLADLCEKTLLAG
jgi:hypothetical protein